MLYANLLQVRVQQLHLGHFTRRFPNFKWQTDPRTSALVSGLLLFSRLFARVREPDLCFRSRPHRRWPISAIRRWLAAVIQLIPEYFDKLIVSITQTPGKPAHQPHEPFFNSSSLNLSFFPFD
jgi:hypothetical protein